MAFTGRVMQASEALPELLFGSFRCEACGAERRGLRQDFAGGLPSRCPRRACGSRTHWRLQDEGPATQWGDWRRLRLQLPTGDCFAAASPRCVTAFVRTERGGCCDPGTNVVVSGCLTALPLPSSRSGSFQAAHEFAILGNLVPVKPELAADVQRPGQLAARRPPISAPRGLPAPEDRGRLLDKLASAIAPAVVGHLEAKKGLVLMLLGGVGKKNGDGSQLRGNIHLCLLGSAGTAKSSLLKWVAELVPQSVYTSGLSSSAPGLTASLLRDPGSGAHALSPGALMQAGNGICCIDDFDLLEQGSRHAVHDAMDREEINLAKAGLHARLNVGASVLAACSTRGPASGLAAQRPSEARIPASVASRFDLVLPLDAPGAQSSDEEFARDLLSKIQGRWRPGSSQVEAAASSEELMRHVRQGRALDPEISPEAGVRLKSCYADMRRQGAFPACGGHVGPRQLESLIRLSEATARAYLEDQVTVEHVNGAFRFMTDMLRNVQLVPDSQGPVEAIARPLKRSRGGVEIPRMRRRN